MFVRARGGEGAAFGVGKLIARAGELCTVEYFDMPAADPLILTVSARDLEAVTLPGQMRVYQRHEGTEVWETGRVIDDHGDALLVQFPNGASRQVRAADLHVRWDLPIRDPTPLLAQKISESPRFAEGRVPFIRSQTAQRAAAMGMSALLPSAIELEAHQIEVVRRVLQDPIQRYLLADEVGLGKTIEAGVLIRQCVLDAGEDAAILILAPRALIAQWRRELSDKFFLAAQLDRSIRVAALDDLAAIERHLPTADMLVVDEAHHVTGAKSPEGQAIYRSLAARAPAIERVLLLSATPALHNERGFLEMLHLLDPSAYRLEDEAGFRRKIEERQAVAEIVAALTPQNALYLDYTLDQISSLFPGDDLLQEQTAALRARLDEMPAEDDPGLVESIERLQAHLSETYRLHRRILRHRRRNVGGLTPNRAGVRALSYASAERAFLSRAIEEWRAGDPDASAEVMAGRYWAALDRASQYAVAGEPEAADMRLADPGVRQRLARAEHFEDRLDGLVSALPELMKDDAHLVLFSTDEATADAIYEALGKPWAGATFRHSPDQEDWLAFNDQPGAAILVCDRRAEEGLNLQGGRKVVVHFDLPLNANRIEQRMGRTDRYGSGDAVTSVALICRDDPVDAAWFAFLDTALKVFDRSVASLQYLIEDLTQRLAATLFAEGVEAFADLQAESAGDEGLIEREIQAIDQQDALDALGAPGSDVLDALSDVDDAWRHIASDTAAWLERTLQFARLERADGGAGTPGADREFRYLYTTTGHRTLIPLATFLQHCGDTVDRTAVAQGGKALGTHPYAFARRTVLRRRRRAAPAGLLRYGDPLISGLTDITQADDRGRAFAMWRHVPGRAGDAPADVYFRFDFMVEAALEPAFAALETHGLSTLAARAAVRRRGDMSLSPFFQTLWLDRDLMQVSDPANLDLLRRPYAPDGAADVASDLNLNFRRWPLLRTLRLPELDNWAALCRDARRAAETALRSDRRFVEALSAADEAAAEIERRHLGQLRARARNAAATGDGADPFQFESDLSSALRTGVRAPQVTVDTAAAVMLSGDARARDLLSGEFR